MRIKKDDIINILLEDRRDSKNTIDKLISLNERLFLEFRDIISNLQRYLQKEKIIDEKNK